MKKGCVVLLAAVLLSGRVSAAQIPEVSAACAVLMDADSGRVLYEKAGDEPRLIASITKLMTALVAAESGHSLDETVTVRREWTGIEGSSIYLRPGEQLRLETLLYGLLLRSGNDAAHAVAGHCAESVEGFVQAMNDKAAALGMSNTHFENPSGLNGDGHYSTARDMAILARAVLENESLAPVVAAKSVTLEGRVFTNHNKLLWRYDGCIGLKTGYTEKAGRTLVSAARRDGMTLICVTLNAPDDWQDHTALLDYGFERYERRCLITEGEVLCTLPAADSIVPLVTIRAGEGLYAALRPEERVEWTPELTQTVLKAPVEAGEVLGTAVCRVGGEVLAELPLTAPCSVSCNAAPARRGLFEFLGH